MTNVKESQGLFQRSGFSVNVRGLEKKYVAGGMVFHALNDVACDMPSGQVTVCQGPSGCGKTTLMNILGGVDRAEGGSVSVGGIDLAQEKDEHKLARYRLNEVGFVFQAFNLIPGLSALDNLQLPMTVVNKRREERNERGHALLKLVGMEQKSGKRPDELSGGEQQRVAIALALVNDPPLILADEPTGNLDSNNARIVIELLCSLAHDFGKTVVITTHDSLVAEKGDQRLYMRDGQFTSRH
jgi:ABC-type lipoprotein export system ATPase subunit